jgi:translocation and assembly module TamA
VWADRALEVPESLRFRVGGDQSVRGYEHRALGPETQAPGGRTELGGRLMWSASLEALQPLPRWGGIEGLGLAAFVDAGQAAQTAADVRPAWGRGLGLRWRSPIGLLRADLAKGEKAWGGGWRLHISVGMAL